jgi:hypothetical protein
VVDGGGSADAGLQRYAGCSMSAGPLEIYRSQLIAAFFVDRPIVIARVADLAALDRICERLLESEQAHRTLRAKGYGRAWFSIAEIAEDVPDKSKS